MLKLASWKIEKLLTEHEKNRRNRQRPVRPNTPPLPPTSEKQKDLDSSSIHYALVEPSAPPLPSTSKKQQGLDSPSVTQPNKKRKLSHTERVDEERNRSPENSRGRGGR